MGLRDRWHGMLVYFGLADDDTYYEDDDEDGSAANEDLQRTYRERPNVRRIDQRRSKGGEIDDIFSEEPAAAPRRRGGGRRSDPHGATAVLRPAEAQRAGELAKVHLIAPRSFNDAQTIADRFKRNIPVIINLQSAETQLAKRLIDFASGLTYALDGGMQRIADKVFLLTPRDVELSAEDRARYLDAGFFNQA